MDQWKTCRYLNLKSMKIVKGNTGSALKLETVKISRSVKAIAGEVLALMVLPQCNVMLQLPKSDTRIRLHVFTKGFPYNLYSGFPSLFFYDYSLQDRFILECYWGFSSLYVLAQWMQQNMVSWPLIVSRCPPS